MMLLNIKSQLPPGVKLWANWMGWFNGADGKKHRANICQSDDIRTIRNQVLAAHSVGIDGFVVDWYSATPDYAQPTDKATQLLAVASLALGMEFSIMLDSGAFKWAPDRNKALSVAMAYIRQKYVPMENYSKINSKPILWEFGWANAGMDVSSFARNNPDFIVLSQTSVKPNCAGSFGWVNGGWGPNNGFCAPDAPHNYMRDYLSRKDALQIPCLFDGFNDTNPNDTAHSIWYKDKAPRIMPYGQWQMCLDEINKAATQGKKFPAVQICTWNDYDEGTAIEPQVLAQAGLKLF